MQRPYKFIVPLGDWCIVPHQLAKRELRKFSLPFDWTFSNWDAVLHILSVEYPEQCVYVNTEHSKWPVYPDSPKQFVFAHHDVTNPETIAYWTRCLQRLQWILKQSEPVLFIHAGVDESLRSISKLQSLKTLLKTKYSQLEYDILSIQQHCDPSVPASRVIFNRVEPQILYADVVTKTRWRDEEWNAPRDLTIWDVMLSVFPIQLGELPPHLSKKEVAGIPHI